MTVEQKISEKVAEVEERRKALEKGVDIDKVAQVAIGLLNLWLEHSNVNRTISIHLVERIQVSYRQQKIAVVVYTSDGAFYGDKSAKDNLSIEIRKLNGTCINDAEDVYLRAYLKKYYDVRESEDANIFYLSK